MENDRLAVEELVKGSENRHSSKRYRLCFGKCELKLILDICEKVRSCKSITDA